MIKNFAELIEKARSKKTKRLVVAAAEDKVVINAVKMAADIDLVEPVLVGDEKKIAEISKDLGINSNWKIINETNKKKASAKAVAEISEGRGDILMKGLVGTPILLKAVLNKDAGLRKSKVLSHVGVIGAKTYPKLIIMTDGGMVPAPDLMEKSEILKNAIRVARGFEINPVRAAIVSSLETVSDKVTSTVDAAALAKMGDRNQFGKDVIVDGPLALDNAISEEAAKHKGIVSDVAGKPDILIMPSVEAGNIFYKTLVYLGNCEAETAGVVLGAKVPVIVPSRTDTAESKMNAIATSVLIAEITD
jgi:phosphate butyryltransferase